MKIGTHYKSFPYTLTSKHKDKISNVCGDTSMNMCSIRPHLRSHATNKSLLNTLLSAVKVIEPETAFCTV